MRAFIAGVVLLLPALIMQRPQPSDIKTWLTLGTIGLSATTLGFFGMFHASEFVSPGIATVIGNAQPLMAAVLATFMLKEYLSGSNKTGLLLGFIGIVLIAFPSFLSGTENSFSVGVVYIFISTVGITLSNVLIRKIAGKVDALSAMGWQLIFGSIFLGLIALATEDVEAVTWNAQFLLSLLGLALPGTALAYWLWCYVLEQVELSQANVFSFLVPIFGLTMGVLFFQESIGLTSVLGIVLTLAGIWLVNRPANKKNGSSGEIPADG